VQRTTLVKDKPRFNRYFVAKGAPTAQMEWQEKRRRGKHRKWPEGTETKASRTLVPEKEGRTPEKGVGKR